MILFEKYARIVINLAKHLRYRYLSKDDKNKYFQDFVDYALEFKSQAELKDFLVTEDGIFVRTNIGLFVWYDPRFEKGVLWGVEKSGEWEPEVTKLCIERLKDGGTFFDIGANVGLFAMSVAFTHNDLSIHSFEAIPDIYNILRKNLEINNLTYKVVVNNLALGRECKTVEMVSAGQCSHVLGSDEAINGETISINCTSLDSYCKFKGINDVKLIKCDVEGFELEVILGAYNTIVSQKPILIIEIEDRWTLRYGHSGKDVFTYLENMGYFGRSILKDGTLGRSDYSVGEKLKQSNVFIFEFDG